MIRPASVILIAMALCSCGEEPVDDSVGADMPRVDARLNFRGKDYDLTVRGHCGPTVDGGFRTFAATLDEDGNPLPDGPQLLALSQGNWSVIDFYPGTGEEIVRIYREGAEKLEFVDGVLEFDGALGAGLTENARVSLVCPPGESLQADGGTP